MYDMQKEFRDKNILDLHEMKFNSHLQKDISEAFEIIDYPGEQRGDTSRLIMEQMGKKEFTGHKITKLKKREDFKISGLPRPISLHTLNDKR